MSDCLKYIDHYCYVCGKFMVKESLIVFSGNVEKAYERYFSEQVIHNVSWAPSKICKTCYNSLMEWWKGERTSMQFGVPTIWTDPGTHNESNCYVCVNRFHGENRKKRRSKKYVSTVFVQLPLPHSDAVPIPKPPISDLLSTATVAESATTATFSELDETYEPSEVSKRIVPITQERLDFIVRKLSLSQRKAEELASFLKDGNHLESGVKVTGYRRRQTSLQNFFTNNASNTFVYCNDVNGLMKEMDLTHIPNKWRLFIDASKSSLKAVLLYYNNTKPSIPIAYSTETKETYNTMETILNSVEYANHQWRICCDLKVTALLCGLQTGYTKHMCFLCLWDTRYSGNHYQKKDWPSRGSFVHGHANVVHTPLVPKEKIMLPPLHIKLGIVKNFVKKLNPNGPAHVYLCSLFPGLTDAKIREGMFNGPDIRKLMKNSGFDECLDAKELTAWNSIKAVIHNFLGKHRAQNYRVLVSDMIQAFEILGVSMSLKIHFLHNHLDYFENQLSTESDEQGERFHQVTIPMEMRYKGKKLNSMLGDICWWLKKAAEDSDEGADTEDDGDGHDHDTRDSTDTENDESSKKGETPPKKFKIKEKC